VVVLDNLSTGFRWAVPQEATMVVGDVGDQVLVSRVIAEHGVNSILHFAAKIVVPESVTDPLAYYFNNTVKTRALIEAAVQKGIKNFVFSSTAAVYGNAEAPLLTEDMPLVPINPYGRSKLMSEWMLQDAHTAHGLRYAILRYFNVAGADPKGRSGQSTPQATHLIKVAAQAALGQRPHLDVFGTDYDTPDGTCVRDYIHVCDLADAHVRVLDALDERSRHYNVGIGRGYSVREVLASVRRVTGAAVPERIAPRRAGDPPTLVAAPDRIRRELGWTPRFPEIDQIVGTAWQWRRANPHGFGAAQAAD
jgi:UDP-glucose 4-epimerase